MHQENIQLTQKKDDIKLQEMLQEMEAEIKKQRQLEIAQREERRKFIEEENNRKKLGKNYT
jgi:hypothetical protein